MRCCTYPQHVYLSWGRWIPSWSVVGKSSCLPGSQSGDTKVATQPLPSRGPTSGQLGEITPIVFGVPEVWSESKEISRIVLVAHLGRKCQHTPVVLGFTKVWRM